MATEWSLQEKGQSPPGAYGKGTCCKEEEQVHSGAPHVSGVFRATWEADSMRGAPGARRGVEGDRPTVQSELATSRVCSEFKNPFASEALKDDRHLPHCALGPAPQTSLAEVLLCVCVCCGCSPTGPTLHAADLISFCTAARLDHETSHVD